MCFFKRFDIPCRRIPTEFSLCNEPPPYRFQMRRTVIPSSRQYSFQLIVGNQLAESFHVFRTGIPARHKRRVTGRSSRRPHHLQPLIMIPFQKAPMGRRRRILIFPTHIHAFFRKQTDRLIQFVGVPDLHHFLFGFIA